MISVYFCDFFFGGDFQIPVLVKSQLGTVYLPFLSKPFRMDGNINIKHSNSKITFSKLYLQIVGKHSERSVTISFGKTGKYWAKGYDRPPPYF